MAVKRCQSSRGATNMKSIIALLCLFAISSASPQVEDRVVAILRDERVDNGDGNFNYVFAADNGIEMEVAGSPGADGQVNMQGFYLLPLESGGLARVEFLANEAGFQPQSEILPTPHPVPVHVQELLAIAEQQRRDGVQFDDQGRRLN